jgi:hypothetical protein
MPRTAAGRCIRHGEEGAGKSSLVEAFLDDIAARDTEMLVTRGQCTESFGQHEPYHPILEALDSMTRDTARGTASLRGQRRHRRRTNASPKHGPERDDRKPELLLHGRCRLLRRRRKPERSFLRLPGQRAGRIRQRLDRGEYLLRRRRWAGLVAGLRRKGQTLPLLDSMIAATALEHDLIWRRPAPFNRPKERRRRRYGGLSPCVASAVARLSG